MKCLTIKQPWASLICPTPEMIELWKLDKLKEQEDMLGDWVYRNGRDLPKNIENRTWYMSYRGPMLIHAGKSWDMHTLVRIPGLDSLKYPRGAIVGHVNVVNCFGPPRFPAGKWHEEDQYAICTEDSVTLEEPIPFCGQQGLFDVPDNILSWKPPPPKDEQLSMFQ